MKGCPPYCIGYVRHPVLNKGEKIMKENYMSIEQAAALLEVSPTTVRRRIRKGELKAEKQLGPYGEQYYIPNEEVNTAQMITDVVPVVRQLDVRELAEAISLVIRQEADCIVDIL